jgi:hypothetical protein
MPVTKLDSSGNSTILLASRKNIGNEEFARQLRNNVTAITNGDLQTDSAEKSAQRGNDISQVIELGRISKETPTVSHILKNNPEYSQKCWDIIFSSGNRGKQFTAMKEGTVVALKADSNELLWGKELSMEKERVTAALQQKSQPEQQVQRSESGTLVGTITKDKPTVSHLFQANGEFDKTFWSIIHSPVNRDKAYTSLRPGTEVVLNQKTGELSFNHHSGKKDIQAADAQKTIHVPLQDTLHHTSLADAVKPYIGTPYNKIDCYGLIVRGLQNQGLQYKGEGGIREKLETLAAKNGLPRNAYFNGEGLVNKAGTKIYSKSMLRIYNTKNQTEQIYTDMKPFLHEGRILSFSTPTQGHTGVISRQGEEWTYINSGVIDNEIQPVHISKGVGEEFLKAELKNWMVLAADKKESLTVTIGQIGDIELKKEAYLTR